MSSTSDVARGALTTIADDVRPVAASVVALASQRASLVLAEADARADATLADARRRADEILAAARESGAADARRAALAIVADARRTAREEVLAAQRRLYERAREEARRRLVGLVASPEAAVLRDRLGAAARRRLGDDAVVTSPEGELGVVAHRGARRLDLATDTLLDAALASLGPAIAELWR